MQLSSQYPPLRLVSAVMATEDEQQAMRRRRGYWIKRARERKGLTLQYVAVALGYSDNSLSTPSLWESGKRPVPSDKMEPLSRLLSLPPRFLVSPPLTDEELLDQAVRDAEELEREDWAAAEDTAREGGDVRVASPRRRSA